MIRDILLTVYAVGWLAVVLVTVWRTGTVPPELWAVLGVGVGALLAAFRVDSGRDNRTAGGASSTTEESP